MKIILPKSFRDRVPTKEMSKKFNELEEDSILEWINGESSRTIFKLFDLLDKEYQKKLLDIMLNYDGDIFGDFVLYVFNKKNKKRCVEIFSLIGEFQKFQDKLNSYRNNNYSKMQLYARLLMASSLFGGPAIMFIPLTLGISSILALPLLCFWIRLGFLYKKRKTINNCIERLIPREMNLNEFYPLNES